MPLAAATASNHGKRRLRQQPQPPDLSIGSGFRHCRRRPPKLIAREQPFCTAPEPRKASQPFRLWHLCPAPPVARQRAATALPRHRPGRCMVETMPRPGFYSGPTPRLQRLTRARPRHAPATKPAAEVLPALVMHFASWVTWLEGVIPRASGRMCGLPPAIVSASWQNARIGHFGGQNTEATPYPSITAFRRSWGHYVAPKQRFRQRLPRHSPASPCGPFMVELFTAVGFANGPRTWSRSGSGCHQPKAPHAGTR